MGQTWYMDLVILSTNLAIENGCKNVGKIAIKYVCSACLSGRFCDDTKKHYTEPHQLENFNENFDENVNDDFKYFGWFLRHRRQELWISILLTPVKIIIECGVTFRFPLRCKRSWADYHYICVNVANIGVQYPLPTQI